jgi:phage baseplate assembly protein W
MTANTNLYKKIVIPQNNAKSQDISPTKMYRGFSTVSKATESVALYDFELIKQDLLNHFYTRQGERLMNPTFGTIIWDILFEPLTPPLKDLIVQNVNEIVNYDPRVQAENVIVTSYDQGIQIECTLHYLSYNIQQTLQLKFDQNNGLLIG